jgi:Tfp pilus assembly protein PilV
MKIFNERRSGSRHNTRDARFAGCSALPSNPVEAFTLIEVMLAITIFFMAMFAILSVLTSGVRAATLLRNNGPTAGMVIAQMSATNKLEEGSVSGTFKDIPIYKDYRWVSNVREVATNGLFQVDVVVVDQSGNQYSTMSALLYRPDSGNGKLGLQTR